MKSLSFEDESKLYIWDLAYYSNIQKKENFSIDSLEVSLYFEVRHTISAMLRIFEQLFELKFDYLTTSKWHEDVTTYSVWDSESKNGAFLGYLYIDPLARPGKRQGCYHLPVKRVIIWPQSENKCIRRTNRNPGFH